jgi:acyl phosphate:glycerol-3-phosphate acyltransferase
VAQELALVAAAYLLGAVPFGLLIARLRAGVDLRQVGSGNIGATNVLRAVGKGAAALTLLLDLAKGALAVLVARALGASALGVALVAVAAVLGHVFPVFLGFRGGKGVATTLGAVLAAMPVVGLLLLAIWLGVALVGRYSSLAALAAVVALPGLSWLLDGRLPLVIASGALAVLVVARHHENIARLWHGTEGKIGQRARPSADPGAT